MKGYVFIHHEKDNHNINMVIAKYETKKKQSYFSYAKIVWKIILVLVK